MSNDAFTKMFENVGSVPEAVLNANQLAVANLEKLVNFQFDTVRSYADIWLNQLKAATEITDVEGLRDFYSRQTEVATEVRQKVLDDAKSLAELGTGFKTDFDKLAKETAAEEPPKAA